MSLDIAKYSGGQNCTQLITTDLMYELSYNLCFPQDLAEYLTHKEVLNRYFLIEGIKVVRFISILAGGL